jgi:hypothetical protein
VEVALWLPHDGGIVFLENLPLQTFSTARQAIQSGFLTGKHHIDAQAY